MADDDAPSTAKTQAPEAPGAQPSVSPDGDESEGEPEELVELQLIEETKLEARFQELRKERGLDDDETLRVFFKLFDMWIQLYRLNKCAEVLEEVVPICRQRGGPLHIKGVQALAFTLWKQSKFSLSAELFREIEELIGPSAALCENMGHTFSSMGDYEQAATYFKRALQCIDEEQKLGRPGGNRAGVLLGLGLIEDRLGHLTAALAVVREARQLFRVKAAGKPASLVAKAGMSIAKILLKMAEAEEDEAARIKMEEEAVECERENVQIFEVTCGDDSPLTASALRGLGEALMRRNCAEESQASFARSYHLEAIKDAFDLLAVMEVHNLLVNSHVRTGKPLNRPAFKGYLPTVDIALGRVRDMPQDGNAGAYYKSAGELRAFAEDYAGSVSLLKEAVSLFKTEDPEKVEDLIQHCEGLQVFCEKQLQTAGAPEAAAAKAGGPPSTAAEGGASEASGAAPTPSSSGP